MLARKTRRDPAHSVPAPPHTRRDECRIGENHPGAGGREERDQAAVVDGFHRLDLAADGTQHEVDGFLAARFDLIRDQVTTDPNVEARADLLKQKAIGCALVAGMLP